MSGERELREIIHSRPKVLIFLPSTNELQRFVIAGAFEELAVGHDLDYVVPAAELTKMRAAAPHVLIEANTHAVDVPPDRYAKWAALFQAACFRHSDLSQSFAIRASFALASGPMRLLMFLPAPTRPFVGSLAGRVERMRWLPSMLRRKAGSLRRGLVEACKHPDQFSYVHARAYDRLVRETLDSMTPMPEIADLFDSARPLYVIIPTSLLDVFCNEVLWACEAEGVACLLLQSGWDNLSSKGIIHHQPVYLGCWGRQSGRHASRIQKVPPENVEALGAPHYEFLRPASAAQVEQLRRELGVPVQDRLVLFGGSFRQFDETSALQRLEAIIESGRLGSVKILYRPHPWRADRQHENDFFRHQWKHVIFDPDMRERYLRAREEPGYLKRAVPMYDMAYLARLLSAVDAVISPMSTLLLEALIMDRPTMAIAFGDRKHGHNPSVTAQMTHFNEAKHSGAFVWCDDSNDLEADVQTLLAPGWVERTAQQRGALLRDIVQLGPGTYSQRLAKLGRSVIEPKARKLRAQRTSRKRRTISNAYGANLIVRDYCGVPLADPQVPGYWMHGWIPAYHNVDPALIALHKKEGQHSRYDYESQIRDEKQTTQQWVSRRDQADYLVARGYKHVKAIGLPIVYIREPDPPRVPNSLLVMPPHSHRNHGPGDPLAERYAEMILALRKDFEHIWVCLHEDDIAKAQWIESFSRRGIGIFPSVDQSDPCTLLRLRRILCTFEYVTTNGYGSHIALAAYCGARVSVYGPFAEFPRERMQRTHAVKMFQRLVDVAYNLCTEEALRDHYPFLFVDPKQAVQRKEWGAEEVGESNRLAPAQLAALFGWAVDNNSLDERGPRPSAQESAASGALSSNNVAG